ncbi:MAG: hypothetical protein AB6733_20185 [Clostridiaceae bacterium]
MNLFREFKEFGIGKCILNNLIVVLVFCKISVVIWFASVICYGVKYFFESGFFGAIVGAIGGGIISLGLVIFLSSLLTAIISVPFMSIFRNYFINIISIIVPLLVNFYMLAVMYEDAFGFRKYIILSMVVFLVSITFKYFYIKRRERGI